MIGLLPSVDISNEPSNKNIAHKIRNLAQNEPLFMHFATDERITILLTAGVLFPWLSFLPTV